MDDVFRSAMWHASAVNKVNTFRWWCEEDGSSFHLLTILV